MSNYLYELIKTRRSTRKFTAQAVEKEKIESILNAALMSPSSKNTQPWHFVVVEDRAVLQHLSESREHGSQFLAGAPLAIVVLAEDNGSVWIEDTAIASAYIQLQAESLGLGSCWVQIRDRMKDETLTAEDYIRSLLNIPQGYKILNIIAVGYKDGGKNPHDDTKLNLSKIHYETFNYR
jgi:nitroreductase